MSTLLVLPVVLPLLGDIKLTSVLVFDVGVYLVVIGLAMMVFESFGDDPRPADPATSGEPLDPAEVTS